MQNARKIVLGIALGVVASACNNNTETNKQKTVATEVAAPQINTPVFNADSAYNDVARVAAFGPRVPGTKAQKDCALWLEAALKKICDTVIVQSVTVTAGNKTLPCYNVVGVINPKATRRILFLTHWDSRPWADEDVKDKDSPIIAADDGGSGVGVLMEVARQVKLFQLPADMGIDILLEDVEDYGRKEWGEQSWCLGTQYWARNPHVPGYKAEFGILLDMVGAHNAQFPMEGFSGQYAPAVVQMVWQAAAHAGYTSYFPYTNGPTITDDHVPVNTLAGIKTIDIINLNTTGNGSFAPHWHTHADNMSVIDKNTLKAVGQTLIQVIYEIGKGA